MRMIKSFTLALAASAGLSGAALAAGDAETPKEVDFSFEGPFGTYDRASVQRGFQVYREVCAACHSLDFFTFRNLMEVGYSEPQAKAIAAEYTVTDGPDDFGEMFDRPAALFDYMPAPYPNQQAARAANGGAYPPDLSLMVEARANGAEYLYSLLTGYEDPPADEEVSPGLYYNPYFPGHLIAMPMPLFDEMVEYADGTPATVEQMSKDVTHFLAWVSEPNMEQRKSMGLAFLLFMVVFTFLAWRVNKKIWKPVKEGKSTGPV